MNINIITSSKNWMESSAIEQLTKTFQLPGMIAAAGMPDLHPGKDAPIGAVFATRHIIYPHLVGTDIGCGMSLWATEIFAGKVKADKIAKKLKGLETPWDGDINRFLVDSNLDSTPFDSSLGTIGGGNHFAEFQRVQKVFDNKYFEENEIDKRAIFLLVHSGSRGFGERVLREYQAVHKNEGLSLASDEGIRYLEVHDKAVSWASSNRRLIANRFLQAVNARAKLIVDICHNSVRAEAFNDETLLMHRKGAAPTTEGAVVIPGSRGSLSYLVLPTGKQDINLATVAHGAGRKWKRSECKGRLSNHFSKMDLLQTTFGSRVICDNKNLLYEEAPEAYKNIDTVVEAMVDLNLIRVIATFAPIVTYKTRAEVVG